MDVQLSEQIQTKKGKNHEIPTKKYQPHHPAPKNDAHPRGWLSYLIRVMS